VKVVVAIDLENRYSGDVGLLEACVRDGVSAFNRHVGQGASIALARLCGDAADISVMSEPLRRTAPLKRRRS